MKLWYIALQDGRYDNVDYLSEEQANKKLDELCPPGTPRDKCVMSYDPKMAPKYVGAAGFKMNESATLVASKNSPNSMFLSFKSFKLPDEDPIDRTFGLTRSQVDKINQWASKIDEQVAREQSESGDLPDWLTDEGREPYYGAIGGSLTYKFTPTSIGVVVKVKHSHGEELDVSDYDCW